MIFSIPRSNSSMEYHYYHKSKTLNQNKSELSHRKSKLLARSNGNEGSSIKRNFYQSQISSTRFIQSPKKQLLYKKKRSQSCDRYLIENKKKVQSQIIQRNLNPYEKKIYRDSEENRQIYFGKKLVDPIHQKFNYFIKHEKKPKPPLLINDFLLEPCQINSKKLQTRTFISHSFIHTDQREESNLSTRNRTHGLRIYHNPRNSFSRNEASQKLKQKNMELSPQYYVMGSKFQSKHYCVDPWEFDPLSQNMDSIKIH